MSSTTLGRFIPTRWRRPHARHLSVDLEALTLTQISSRVDALGFGGYQWGLLLAVGLSDLAESMDMGAVQPQNAALAVFFNLPISVRAALPAVVYFGSGFGIALGGFMADLCGRRAVLMLSNIAIVAAQVLTALLPLGTPHWIIIILRLAAGVAGGLAVAPAKIIAAESCPTKDRTWFLYSLAFIGSSGYLLSALGLHIFMPGFGESPHDRWRAFALLNAGPALLSLILTPIFVSESPAFFAVRGRVDDCVDALDRIASANAKELPGDQLRIPAPRGEHSTRVSGCCDILQSTLIVFGCQTATLLALSIAESAKVFFVAGFSYLTPQLFSMVKGGMVLDATTLYMISCLAPLIGLIIGSRMMCAPVGVNYFLFSMWAATMLCCLATIRIGSAPLALLAFVMGAKLCFGPMNVLLSLMKVGGFPAEVRAIAFAFVSLMARSGAILAPMQAEIAKGDGWTSTNLVAYIQKLVTAAVISGIAGCLLSRRVDSQKSLQDFVPTGPAAMRRKTSTAVPTYGTLKGGEAGTEASQTPRGRRSTIPTADLEASPDESSESADDFDSWVGAAPSNVRFSVVPSGARLSTNGTADAGSGPPARTE